MMWNRGGAFTKAITWKRKKDGGDAEIIWGFLHLFSSFGSGHYWTIERVYLNFIIIEYKFTDECCQWRDERLNAKQIKILFASQD
jgi:hypothetical protein